MAEEALAAATTLPTEEAADVIRRGLDKGAEVPRDLDHVGKNGDGVPTIEITVAEHEVNDQAVAALAADPDLYQRGHLLNRVLREPPRLDDMVLGRDPGGLTITPIHTSTLRERLTKYATWVKPKRGEDGESQLVPAHPPDWSVQAVANRGVWRGLRMLEGVTEVPLFRADGTILDTPGWDRKTGILYVPEIDYPAVPDRPTLEDARRAADALFEIVADFPFKDEDHRVVWLAALLTPIARPAIHGPCPMFVFDANIAGTGKSMLVDIISLITVGRCMGRTIYPASEEEMGKTMLAIAMGGSRLVLFDNAATGYPIGGPTLDAALTGGTWSGRVLQVSKFATDVPLCAVFFSSGNNLGLKGDTLRRIVLSQLESTDERPEERDNFKIPRLLDHVRARRGILAVHALTILEAYHVAGRPIPAPKPPPMGSFEGWNDLVRRAVHWVTGHDPCATKSEAKSIDKITATLPIVIDGWSRLCAGAGKGGLTATAGLQALEGNPRHSRISWPSWSSPPRTASCPTPTALAPSWANIAEGHSRRGTRPASSSTCGSWASRRSAAPRGGSCATPRPTRTPTIPRSDRGGGGRGWGSKGGRSGEFPKRLYRGWEGVGVQWGVCGVSSERVFTSVLPCSTEQMLEKIRQTWALGPPPPPTPLCPRHPWIGARPHPPLSAPPSPSWPDTPRFASLDLPRPAIATPAPVNLPSRDPDPSMLAKPRGRPRSTARAQPRGLPPWPRDPLPHLVRQQPVD